MATIDCPTWTQATRLTCNRLDELALEHQLSLGARVVLGWLTDHDLPDRRCGGRRKGFVTWKVVSIADRLRISERRVYRCLGELVRAGLITRDQRGRGLTARTILHYERIIGDAPPPPLKPPRTRSQSSSAKPADRLCQTEQSHNKESGNPGREGLGGLSPDPHTVMQPTQAPPRSLRDPAARIRWQLAHCVEVPYALHQAARSAYAAGNLAGWCQANQIPYPSPECARYAQEFAQRPSE